MGSTSELVFVRDAVALHCEGQPLAFVKRKRASTANTVEAADHADARINRVFESTPSAANWTGLAVCANLKDAPRKPYCVSEKRENTLQEFRILDRATSRFGASI